MNLSSAYEDAKLDLQVAPLIDVVFLLLIYFMVTSSLIKKEGDISFMLPADVPQVQMVDIPIDARIRIAEDDSVSLDGRQYAASNRDLEELIDQLAGLKQMAESTKSPFFVTLDPQPDTKHRRIIDVMDACAAAKVSNLTFAKKD